MTLLLLCLLVLGFSHGAEKKGKRPNLHEERFIVEGVLRKALIFIPRSAVKTPAPVVFVFHGHGGTAEKALEQFGLLREWPEAISVHMQGLNTPSAGDPEGKKPGWQNTAGEHDDRDLKFFDAVLEHLLKSGKADKQNIYVTGFSNGGAFTYLLWAQRGEKLAAVALCAAPIAQMKTAQLMPKPVLKISGRTDPKVRLENQQQAVEDLRKLNGCEGPGRPWGRLGTLYRSKNGTPVISLVHPGGHTVPENVPVALVKFFQGRMRNEEATD